jgi:cytoskeletal protein CcmA (bactofilin family)
MARTRSGGGGETVIGQSTRVHGRISGDGDLRVEGSVEGDISLRGDLVVTSGARAVSNVEARALTMGGELEGDVRAEGLVHLESGARMRGDIHTESIAIDDGAEFIGRLSLDFELPAELDESSGGRRR